MSLFVDLTTGPRGPFSWKFLSMLDLSIEMIITAKASRNFIQFLDFIFFLFFLNKPMLS